MSGPIVPDAAILGYLRDVTGVAYSSLNDVPDHLVMATRDRLQAALPALLAANGGGGSPTPYEVRRDALYAAAVTFANPHERSTALGSRLIVSAADVFAQFLTGETHA